MRKFWEQYSNNFPRLSKISNYVSLKLFIKITKIKLKLTAINASSSEVERLFSIVSGKTRDTAKNRQTMETVESSLQLQMAPPFKKLVEDAKPFLGLE
jgi:hypothetical protein